MLEGFRIFKLTTITHGGSALLDLQSRNEAFKENVKFAKLSGGKPSEVLPGGTKVAEKGGKLALFV